MSTLDDRLQRGRQQHGERFDPSDLLSAPQLHNAYDTNARIEVDVYGDGQVILRGRVSSTTGWRPAFLLMRRRSDHGSSWLLDSRTRILRTVGE